MSKYRIAKIRKALSEKKAYIKSYCLEPILYMGCPIKLHCFVVVCPDKTYLVPCEDAPILVLFTPFPIQED